MDKVSVTDVDRLYATTSGKTDQVAVDKWDRGLLRYKGQVFV